MGGHAPHDVDVVCIHAGRGGPGESESRHRHRPQGYQVTYSHDFTKAGMGDWVTQPGAGAAVSVSSRDGLG
jgi:hypothetical protein